VQAEWHCRRPPLQRRRKSPIIGGHQPGKKRLRFCELDALPVEQNTGLPFSSHVRVKNARGEEIPIAHACGHDLHMTVWIGTARRLVAERDRWSGTLIMIAQPAE